MGVECVRDLLKINQVVGKENFQLLVEGDIIVPDSNLAIEKVLDIDGLVFVNSREVIQDRLMIEGSIRYNVLYVAEGEEYWLDCIEVDNGFTHYLDIPGAKPKMASHVEIEIEHIEYEVINSRRISAKAVLNIEGRVDNLLSIEAIREFKNAGDMQILKEKVDIAGGIEEGRSQTIVREDMELDGSMPPVKKILRKDARVNIEEQRVVDGGVVAEGNIELKVLYLCEEKDNPLRYFSKVIPFRHHVEIQGAFEGMKCRTDASLQDVYVEPKQDISGDFRIVNAEFVVDLSAQVFETEEREIISDAYSLSKVVDLKKETIELMREIAEREAEFTIDQSISIPDKLSGVPEIVYTDGKTVLIGSKIDKGKVTIEGILSANLIYLVRGKSMRVNSIKEEIPFEQTVDVEGIDEKMECEIQLDVDKIDFSSLTSDEVGITATVTMQIAVFEKINKEVVVEVKEIKDREDKEGGIFIYFVRPGDSVWDIAKRYNTTVDQILELNDIEDQNHLRPGDRVIVYKKLDASIA